MQEADRRRIAEEEALAARLAAEEAEREAEQLRVQEAVRREQEAAEKARRADPAWPCLLGARLTDGSGRGTTAFLAGEEMNVHVSYRVPRARRNLVIGFEILRSDDLYLFAVSNYQYDVELPVPSGPGEFAFRIPALALNDGTYRLRLSLFPEPDEPNWDRHPEDVLEEGAMFTVSSRVRIQGCTFLEVSQWQAFRSDGPLSETFSGDLPTSGIA
jgi:hypothetical protein